MTKAVAEKCRQTVNRGSRRWSNPQPCGRPVIEDGLCKLHLRVRANREKKQAKWEANWTTGEALQAEAAALSDRLGIDVRADYSWARREYTGRFSVPGEWLREHDDAR